MYLYPVTVEDPDGEEGKLHLLIIAPNLKRATEMLDKEFPTDLWNRSQFPKEEEIDYAMKYRHWAWEVMDTHHEEIVVLEDTTHLCGLSDGHNVSTVEKQVGSTPTMGTKKDED